LEFSESTTSKFHKVLEWQSRRVQTVADDKPVQGPVAPFRNHLTYLLTYLLT